MENGRVRTNARVWVLPHDALLRLDNTDQVLDECGLAGTVDTDARNTRGHRRAHSDVVDGWRRVARVRERDVVHLEQRLAT